MTYDPLTYWQASGTDSWHPDHERNFRHSDVFARQEAKLLTLLDTLTFDSILEVGCGFGRITALVHARYPLADYTAIDLSAERLASAREKVPAVTFRQSTLADYQGPPADLVLAVEVLMHVLPADIADAAEKLLTLGRDVVTVDWDVPIRGRPISDINVIHPYADLYGARLVSREVTDLQAIYHARV